MSFKMISLLRGKKAALIFFGVVVLALVGIFHSALPVSAANPGKAAPVSNIPESQWGKWKSSDIGRAFPTVKIPFSMGQKIIVPNQIAIQVDEVDQNWQPQAWQVSPHASSIQDAVGGNQEVILIRFTITNLSSTPLGYSSLYFSLVRSNGDEQRIADLNALTSDQYGAFGDTNPWLKPGVTKHSMVPFVVNKGEQNLTFVYYVYNVDWIENSGPPLIPVKGSKHKVPNQTPKFVDIARVPVTFSLKAPTTLPTASGEVRGFVPSTTFTVQSADVYSH